MAMLYLVSRTSAVISPLLSVYGVRNMSVGPARRECYEQDGGGGNIPRLTARTGHIVITWADLRLGYNGPS